MMGFRPKHLSVSAVELYVKCPAQYRARYIDKTPTLPTVPMSWGIAFHRALEAGHRGQDAESAWLKSFNDMQAECARRGDVFAPNKTHGLTLLGEFANRGLMRPGRAEVKFVLSLPAGNVPVPIMGFIDAVLDDEMREYKTSAGRWWTEAKAQTSFQTATYGWAHQRLYRRRVPMRYVIFGTRNPTVTEYVVSHSPELFRVFEQTTEMVWQGIVDERYEGCGTCQLCAPVDTPAASESARFDLEGIPMAAIGEPAQPTRPNEARR